MGWLGVAWDTDWGLGYESGTLGVKKARYAQIQIAKSNRGGVFREWLDRGWVRGEWCC